MDRYGLILIDENNVQEIKMSIVGPALEASKYYFEEEQYREMFSSLISASADKTFNRDIHTSFTEVIKQLEPNDAKLLVRISKYTGNKAIPFITVNEIVLSDKGRLIRAKHLLPNQSISQYFADLLSIDNLVRRNLIHIHEIEHFMDEKLYSWVDNHPIKKVYENKTLDLQRGMLSITEYGSSFIRVCLR